MAGAETTTPSDSHRAAYRFGGIALNTCRALPPGKGRLTAYEYFPWDDPEFERDPNPWYTRAQQEVPVLVDDSGDYVVSRYADVVEFGPMECMSVEPGWDAAGPWSVASSTIIGRDAPEHTRLRRQTNKWFAPKAVREWVKTTTAAVNEVLDGMAGETIDGWLDLSVLPTHRAMCRVLEVPDDDAVPVMQEMATTMPMLSARPRQGTRELAAEGFASLAARLDTFLKSEPKPGGLVAAMMEAEDGGKMSKDEVHATLLMLYSLGHMDVGYIVAASLRILAELPEVYEAYRTDPDQRDAIINEVVRYDPPELSFYRTTSEDVTISGVTVPAGSRLRFMMGSANRDPEFFDDPHTFDFLRPQSHSKNMSFGFGTHTCAGQGMARSETRAVLDAVTDRFGRMELAEPFEMDNSDFSRHFTRLTLKFGN
jgi:cytochrome P450